MTTDPIHVAALYRFTPFPDPGALSDALRACCAKAGVRGTLLLAREGINGTIAGSRSGIAAVLSHIRTLPGCADIAARHSRAETMPFGRLKIRIKREIVTMGRPDINPLDDVGRYVDPEAWQALIADPDTILIDTRNAYEVAIGTFAGAIDPGTRHFRDFPQWFRDNRARLLAGRARRRIAMFCTGGIRCEKATAFVKAEGIAEVYHLRGGILNYLEHIPKDRSRWRGGCFVFDERISLGHGLEIVGEAED